MAKSQLEIVLIDEGGASSPADSPASRAANPASTSTSTAAASSPRAAAPQRESTTSAAEAAARAATAAAGALGIGGLVDQVRRFVDVLRDLGVVFKAMLGARAVSSIAEIIAPRATAGGGASPVASAASAASRRSGVEDAEFTIRPTPNLSLPRLGHTSTAVAAPAARAASTAVAAPAATQITTLGVTTAAGTAGTAGASTAAGGIASALGPIGIAAVAVTAAFAALIVGAKKLSEALSDQVGKLEGFSGDVSAAAAETEIRRERAMFDRAERIGPQLAKFEQQRGKIEERFSQMGTQILDVLLKVWDALYPAINKTVSGIEVGITSASVVIEHLRLIIDILTPLDGIDIKGGLDRIAKADENLLKAALDFIRAGTDEDPLVDQFMIDFLSSGDELKRRLSGRRRRGRRR